MNLEDLRRGDSSRPKLTVSGRARDLGRVFDGVVDT
jgi:hypothetical protein